MRPIVGDPRVRADVIAAVDQQITSRLNVAFPGQRALPANLRGLGSTLQLAVDGFVDRVVTKFVRSSTFADLWVQLNRAVHQHLLSLLTTGVTTNGVARVDEQGRVFLDLGAVVARVKQLLIAAGLTIANAVPAVTLLVEVAALHMFHSMRGAVRLTTRAATWLPWVGGGLLAAMLLARRRRRALATCALGVVAGMLVAGGALTISRNRYLDAVPTGPLRRDTVRAAYDIVSGSLSDLIRVILLVSLGVGVIAWLAGTLELATSLRRTARAMPGAVINPGRHAVEHAAQLALAAAAVVLVCWTRPTLTVVITVASVTAGVLILLLGAAAARRRTS